MLFHIYPGEQPVFPKRHGVKDHYAIAGPYVKIWSVSFVPSQKGKRKAPLTQTRAQGLDTPARASSVMFHTPLCFQPLAQCLAHNSSCSTNVLNGQVEVMPLASGHVHLP